MLLDILYRNNMTRVPLYATVCVLVRERTLKTRRDCQAEVNGEAEDNLEEGTFNTLLGPGQHIRDRDYRIFRPNL